MFGIDDIAGLLSKPIDDVVKSVLPNDADKAALIKAQTDAAIAVAAQSMSVMLAEAQSGDKWTSRARPSMLYVMYILILFGIPMGILSAVSPSTAANIGAGLGAWLRAVPDILWQMFGVCFLGYTAARSGDKAGGLMPFLTGKKQ